MNLKKFGFRIWFAACLAIFLVTTSSHACNVPVFRYALERWNPHPYEVLIFHKGPLNEVDQKLVKNLRDYAGRAQGCPTNINLEIVDLAKMVGPKLDKIFKSQKEPTLPWLVVRFPEGADTPEPLHAGPLDGAVLKDLFDSPVRREIAKRLLQGQTAVWVFIDSGDRTKDDAKFQFLADHLKELGKKVKLPELTDTPKDRLRSEVKLKVEFSILRMSRQDPKEAMLVGMLLRMEKFGDLPKNKDGSLPGPFAFPILGRGMALYGMVGKGINKETVLGAVNFLVGPCSCEVKEQNPGVDLLMTANWEAGMTGKLTAAPELPPLTGLLPPQALPATTPPRETPSTIPPQEDNSLLWRNLAIALGGGLILLLLGSMLVFARKW